MKEIKLYTAVLLVIGSFTRSFSAHEVTQEVRKRVNDGEYDLTDVDYGNVPELGINGYLIEHNEVKSIIREAQEVIGLKSHHGPNYIIYSVKTDEEESSAPEKNPFTKNIVQQLSQNPFAKQPIESLKTYVAKSIIDGEVGKKVLKYVKDHGPVTIKQIQSRLKRDGNFTCQQIQDFLVSKDLLNPFYKQDKASKTIVK